MLNAREIRFDVRSSEREFIRYIARNPRPGTYNDLAEALGCHKNTIYMIVKRLTSMDVISAVRVAGSPAYRYSIDYARIPDSLRMELDIRAAG